jgi:uracil-DNA glycosylase
MIDADYGESLEELYTRWYQCTKCELGQRRVAVGGKFVFGEGARHGIMIVGEGPGAKEEEIGRPFVGESGMVLRSALAELRLEDVYITNAVCCRSCVQRYSSEGQPMHKIDKHTGLEMPVLKDELPTAAQIAMCYQRLCGEIYHVDPKIIITLGMGAAKALCSERLSTIKSTRAEIREAHIPGKIFMPSRTTSRQLWERKVKGEFVRPTEPFMLRYRIIPTYHPAYLFKFEKDRSPENPIDVFAKDMRMAAMIYDRVMLEGWQVMPSEREISTDFIRGEL